jgi:hypothetical protein
MDDAVPSPFFRRGRRQYVHGQERRDSLRAAREGRGRRGGGSHRG